MFYYGFVMVLLSKLINLNKKIFFPFNSSKYGLHKKLRYRFLKEIQKNYAREPRIDSLRMAFLENHISLLSVIHSIVKKYLCNLSNWIKIVIKNSYIIALLFHAFTRFTISNVNLNTVRLQLKLNDKLKSLKHSYECFPTRVDL